MIPPTHTHSLTVLPVLVLILIPSHSQNHILEKIATPLCQCHSHDVMVHNFPSQLIELQVACLNLQIQLPKAAASVGWKSLSNSPESFGKGQGGSQSVPHHCIYRKCQQLLQTNGWLLQHSQSHAQAQALC